MYQSINKLSMNVAIDNTITRKKLLKNYLNFGCFFFNSFFRAMVLPILVSIMRHSIFTVQLMSIRKCINACFIKATKAHVFWADKETRYWVQEWIFLNSCHFSTVCANMFTFPHSSASTYSPTHFCFHSFLSPYTLSLSFYLTFLVFFHSFVPYFSLLLSLHLSYFALFSALCFSLSVLVTPYLYSLFFPYPITFSLSLAPPSQKSRRKVFEIRFFFRRSD